MIACIVSCAEVVGESKFKTRRAAMVSFPSILAGVRSSTCVVSSVAIGGSSVTPSMDVFEYFPQTAPIVGKWFGNTLQILEDANDPQLVTCKDTNTPVGGAGISTPTDKSVLLLKKACSLSFLEVILTYLYKSEALVFIPILWASGPESTFYLLFFHLS